MPKYGGYAKCYPVRGEIGPSKKPKSGRCVGGADAKSSIREADVFDVGGGKRRTQPRTAQAANTKAHLVVVPHKNKKKQIVPSSAILRENEWHGGRSEPSKWGKRGGGWTRVEKKKSPIRSRTREFEKHVRPHGRGDRRKEEQYERAKEKRERQKKRSQTRPSYKNSKEKESIVVIKPGDQASKAERGKLGKSRKMK